MKDFTLENIDGFIKEIRDNGGVSQRLVASIESLIGSNIITKDISIKNFTQQTSNVNSDRVISALEDYKSSFIKNDVIVYLSSDHSNDFVNKLGFTLKEFIQALELDGWYNSYPLNADEMKKLIIGYGEYFACDAFEGGYINNDKVVAKYTNDVGYDTYIRTFLDAVNNRGAKANYMKAVVSVLHGKGISVNDDAINKFVDDKIRYMNKIAKQTNSDDVFGVIDSEYNHEEVGDIFRLNNSDLVTVDMIIDYVKDGDKNAIMNRLVELRDECGDRSSKYTVDILEEVYSAKIKSTLLPLSETNMDKHSPYFRLFLNLFILPKSLGGEK